MSIVFFLLGLLTIPVLYSYYVMWHFFDIEKGGGLGRMAIIGLWLLSPIWMIIGLFTGELEIFKCIGVKTKL